MKDTRFNNQLPHEADVNLIDRCKDELQDYERFFHYVEPRNHTISYLAAAYLSLLEKYNELLNERKSE